MSDYLDKIAAGYVRQLSRVNRLEDSLRSMFASYCTSPTRTMSPKYLPTMKKKEHARKILSRWYKVFNSASKRIATGK